jgi:hypothetical protein
LYRVNGPFVILTRVQGLYENDSWAGRRVTYRRLQCTGGILSVRLGTDEHLFTVDQHVTARENGRVVGRVQIAPAQQPTLRVPLHPNAVGTCTVTFTALTDRVPARVLPGNRDTRRLAAHYYAFEYAAR